MPFPTHLPPTDPGLHSSTAGSESNEEGTLLRGGGQNARRSEPTRIRELCGERHPLQPDELSTEASTSNGPNAGPEAQTSIQERRRTEPTPSLRMNPTVVNQIPRRSRLGTRTPTNPPIGRVGPNTPARREPAENSNSESGNRTHPRWTAEPAPNDNRHSGEPQEGSTTQRLRNEPNGTLHQPRRKRKSLKIASLNMKGRGDHLQNKWGSINNVMKRRQIAVLGLQETHPSDEMQETIGRRFRNALHIVHSADPDDPSTTGGVSVAIQKSMVDTKGITHRIVIPGRAILVEIPWNGSERLRVLNIYAPARNANKAEFWERLLSDINNDETLRPDVIMGDFNLVENPEIDRLNNRRGTDPTAARNAMTELTTELNMADGWRRHHPGKRGYTFIGSSQSRLDRIYTREDIYPWCTDWKIEHPSFETDHSLVSVQMTSENMPFIGRGRWAIPVNLLRNRQMKKGTQELARKLQADVERTIPTDRTTGDPQLALKTFKASIIELYTLGTNTYLLIR